MRSREEERTFKRAGVSRGRVLPIRLETKRETKRTKRVPIVRVDGGEGTDGLVTGGKSRETCARRNSRKFELRRLLSMRRA